MAARQMLNRTSTLSSGMAVYNIAECPRATRLEFDTFSLDHEQHAEDFLAVDVA